MTRIASAILFVAAIAVLVVGTEAFSPRAALTTTRATTSPTFLAKKKEDLSYLETRDMTKEEMLELNKKNEDIMNMELTAMTGFSLVLSLPIFYLCWVAFFSD
jgi:selenocysteine-specific elongation factor